MLRRKRKVDLHTTVFKAAKTTTDLTCTLFDVKTIPLIFNRAVSTQVCLFDEKSDRQWFNILRDLSFSYKVIKLENETRKKRHVLISIHQMYLALFYIYCLHTHKVNISEIFPLIEDTVCEIKNICDFGLIFNKTLSLVAILRDCCYLSQNSKFSYHHIVHSSIFNKAMKLLMDEGRIVPVGSDNIVFWSLKKSSVERCKLTNLYSKYLPTME